MLVCYYNIIFGGSIAVVLRWPCYFLTARNASPEGLIPWEPRALTANNTITSFSFILECSEFLVHFGAIRMDLVVLVAIFKLKN